MSLGHATIQPFDIGIHDESSIDHAHVALISAFDAAFYFFDVLSNLFNFLDFCRRKATFDVVITFFA